MLAADLLNQFPCGDGTSEFEQSTDVFVSWIEHHLLAHSLLDCITCAFHNKTEEISLRRWYKGITKFILSLDRCCIYRRHKNEVCCDRCSFWIYIMSIN